MGIKLFCTVLKIQVLWKLSIETDLSTPICEHSSDKIIELMVVN